MRSRHPSEREAEPRLQLISEVEDRLRRDQRRKEEIALLLMPIERMELMEKSALEGSRRRSSQSPDLVPITELA